MDAKSYVKSTEYVSKDEAAAKLKNDLGEDFVQLFGIQSAKPTIDVYLHAQYTSPEQCSKIEKYVRQYTFVKEVYIRSRFYI